MKYPILILVIVLLSITVHGLAQGISFTKADPQPVIQEVYSGSLLSGDLDGDGDIDLVQSGLGENLTGQSAEPSVFLNDGDGNFTLLMQDFSNYWTTERMVLSDLDRDGDLDLVIASSNRTDLYLNDGQAQFVIEEDAPFLPSDAGDMIVGDVDGDGDNDVVQYGERSSSNPFALLFLNDGSGSFTDGQDLGFVPLFIAQIEFIDLESDGDLDLVSFGKGASGQAEVRIYENDGAGSYTPFLNSSIAALQAEAISVGDMDLDGDDDLLVTGTATDASPTTLLYINDGSGHFESLSATPFPDVFASSNALADLDNDGDLDVVVIGSMAGGIPNIFSIVFENLGSNSFVAADSLGGEYIATNTIADLNGDDQKDIIIQGFVDDTNIYWNTSVLTTVDEVSRTDFSVFPNPTRGQVQVQWDEQAVHTIEVRDLHYRLIQRVSVSQQELSKRIKINAPTGSYLISVSGDHGQTTKRISLID